MLEAIAPLTCRQCPRLAQFIDSHKEKHPDWHNAPVPSFGPWSAKLAIIGLAPGLRGANATGRPFTGDFAGMVLYEALLKVGLAQGHYSPDGKDDLSLQQLRITNAVRCVPPQNKPTAAEIAQCRPFLTAELDRLDQLQAILVLGRIAHDTVLRHYGLKLKNYPFAHGGQHDLPNGIKLVSSYHCSRYNIQTNRLSREAFETVVAQAKICADIGW